MAAKKTRKTRAHHLLDVIRGKERVLVLTHDNPDPDAIASGWGVVHLIEKTLAIPTRFLAGGIIARAENRALMKILRPPLEMTTEQIAPEPSEAVVLVDTLASRRLAGPGGGKKLDAVIDHHRSSRRAPLPFRFRDIRPKVLSTSSIVTCYLRSLSIEPPQAMATALAYGIVTDAKGMECRFSRADRTAFSWLSQFSDPQVLSRIENPELPRTYFADLLLALESCFIYGSVGFCFLPSASATEAVGETADLLIRCEGIDRLLCAAVVDGRVIISARTTDRGGDATALLGKAVGPRGGTWGGHEHRAGGSIPLDGSKVDAGDIEMRLRTSWLDVSESEKNRGDRLVAKREILRALR
jgi:nanoRNase/pAp phosphatase (c-di-AMP/oligoRNAs hydrolase)